MSDQEKRIPPLHAPGDPGPAAEVVAGVVLPDRSLQRGLLYVQHGREILWLAGPTVLTMLSQTLMWTIDTALLGRVSSVALAASGLAHTIVRPWYVLGPGHRWPYFLLPLYAIAKLLPGTRDGALRLGLVTRAQMTAALVAAVEDPPEGVRVVTVPEIRCAPAA